MAFDLGDTVPLSVDVLDAAGAPVNAASVVLTLSLPDGTTATPAFTNPSTGRYTVNYVPAMSGRYAVRWTSTTPSTAYADTFDVRPANPGYVISLVDAKEHLNITTSLYDEELRGWIEVCTEITEMLTGRTIARRTITERQYLRQPVRELTLLASPAVSLTSITSLDGLAGSWDPAGFDLDPDTNVVRALPSTSYLYGLVRFVYVAGWSLAPAKVVGGAKMILRHLWETQRSGVGSKAPGRGQLLTRANQLADQFSGTTVVVAGYAIPMAAAEVLGPRRAML